MKKLSYSKGGELFLQLPISDFLSLFHRNYLASYMLSNLILGLIYAYSMVIIPHKKVYMGRIYLKLIIGTLPSLTYISSFVYLNAKRRIQKISYSFPKLITKTRARFRESHKIVKLVALSENKSWEIVLFQKESNLLATNGSLLLKLNANGKIDRYKKKLSTQGYTQVHDVKNIFLNKKLEKEKKERFILVAYVDDMVLNPHR
ncbi:hypothetical protein CR513_46327, partial [Mucuna pruriens]